MGRKTRKARERRRYAQGGRRKPSNRKPPAADRPPVPASVQRALIGYGFMALAAAVAIYFITMLDFWVCWLIGVNVTVLIAFSFDKSAAVRNQWRIPELVFHVLAAAGGSPTTWVSRPIFFHKTTKRSFGKVLAIITGVQVLLVIALAYFLSAG